MIKYAKNRGISFFEVTLCLMILGVLLGCLFPLFKISKLKPKIGLTQIFNKLDPFIKLAKAFKSEADELQLALPCGWVRILMKDQEPREDSSLKLVFLKLPMEYQVQWHYWDQKCSEWRLFKTGQFYQHISFLQLCIYDEQGQVAEKFIFATSLQRWHKKQ